MVEHVDFEFVQEGLGTNSFRVVDVRTLDSRTQEGRIPGTCHVPIEQVANAFSVAATTNAEFEKEFDFVRPTKSSRLVLVGDNSDSADGNANGQSDHGKVDRDDLSLATKAAEILLELGYNKVGVYLGGLHDWRRNGGQTLKGHDDVKKEVDFDQLRKGREEGTMTIVDVRTKAERLQTGVIKESVNIPLSEVWQGFKLESEVFKAKYKVDKSLMEDKTLVLYCLKGKRALEAADKLLLLGYHQNVYVYKGSFIDWTNRRGSLGQEENIDD